VTTRGGATSWRSGRLSPMLVVANKTLYTATYNGTVDAFLL
jgi:hypothetical protein